MGGFAALPLVVEVAFGANPLDTGTLTWTDISDYVRRTSGVDFSRGWDTEAAEPLAGWLTLTLNNESGDFTPGETGAFGEIRNRLPIRVSAVIGTATGNALTYDEAVGWYDMLGATYDDTEIGTVVLWTGLVESWRIFWENGVRSQVAVTAVDRWAAIRRTKIDADRIALAAKNTAADLFYPLTEASAPMREINDAGPVVRTIDSLPVYRDKVHPTDPSKSVVGTVAGSPVDSPMYASGDHSVTTGFTITTVMYPSAVVANDQVLAKMYGRMETDYLTYGYAYVGLRHNGTNIVAYAVSSRAVPATSSQDWSLTTNGSTTLSNDRWYTISLTLSMSGSTVTQTLYVDGVQVGTTSTSTGRGDWPSGWGRGFTLDPYAGITAGPPPVWWAGLIVHDRALTSTEVATLAAGTASWTGDTAATRAGRLKSLAGPVTLTTTGTFTATMSSQDLADKSLADALFECATAERGTIYMDPDGWPVLTSRSWRVGSAVAFTIPATALGRDVGWTLDDQQLTNSATVDRMVTDTSAAQVKVRNDTSVATYGEQNKALQVWLDTDAQLLERANAEANIDAVARPRSSELMVDLMTKQATIPAATLLAADIGDRIAVSGLPSEAPSGTEFYIETIEDRVTHTGWERTFTVSPRADYWTLEDATYGALDSVFVLAF